MHALLLCPEQRIVWPKSTSASVTACFDAPVKTRSDGVSDAAAAIVIEKKPLPFAAKGLLGETTAPAGRPVIVTCSFAPAWPQTRAGVEPADHASDDASTMCDAKTQPSGPHLDGHAARADASSSASDERRRAGRRVEAQGGGIVAESICGGNTWKVLPL